MPVRIAPGIKLLLILQFAIFLIQQTSDRFFGTHFFSVIALVPSKILHSFYVWQVFTYSLLQTDVFHLFFNGLIMASFGSELERAWGTRRFVQYYLVCSLGVGLLYLFLSAAFELNFAWCGSAGVMYSVLFAFTLMYGERDLLFMMLFPLKTKHFIWVIALFEFMTALYQPGVEPLLTCIAALGGILIGLLYLFAVITVNKARAAKKAGGAGRLDKGLTRKNRGHLKLVTERDSWGQDGHLVNLKTTRDSDDSDEGPKTWH